LTHYFREVYIEFRRNLEMFAVIVRVQSDCLQYNIKVELGE
ncbi:hypothetical protein J2S19_004881, partial [Metabacillus malikii]|nr:hypothetical protein [Metabacillus malikii]